MGEPAATVLPLEAAEVLPLLTGALDLRAERRELLDRCGRLEAVLAEPDGDGWIPVAQVEAVPEAPGWRLAAVACDGPRHPGRPRYRAVFARLRAFMGTPPAVCESCGGSGWLPLGEAATGVVLRAAGFRLWRGVVLPPVDPRLQLAAQRDMVDLFLSMGSPPPVPTERPHGARAGNGLGALLSTTAPTPPAAPSEAPAAGPGPGAATSGEEP